VRRIAFLAAAAACLFVPVAVQAQDLTPDATRYLSDPNYLPYGGQIYGYTTYDHSWTSGDTVNYLGVQTSSFRENADAFGQFLSYGITDDLELNAAIHADADVQRQVDLANGTEPNLNSSGFSDPSFGVVWRALDQASAPVDLDLFGNFAPNWIDSRLPSPTDDGTIARGGSVGTVGAALGYGTHQLSVRGSVYAEFNGHSDSLDLGDNDLVRTDGYTDYVLSLTSQARLNQLFSVNAGISHTFLPNENVLNLTTGTPHVTEPGNSTVLSASLNYNLIPNTAVISATYSHSFLGNIDYVYANPVSDSSTRDRSGDTVGVRVDYVLP